MDDGYLISNYHVVKDATKVRLLTGAGLIDAKVVQVDEANDLALLKADGKFSPLPISSSRPAQLGDPVARVGFPDIGLQGFAGLLTTKYTNYTKNKRQIHFVSAFVCLVYFVVNPFRSSGGAGAGLLM